MRKNNYILIWASVLVICLTGAARADVKIKMSQRKSMPGMPGPINTPMGVKDPSQMPDTIVYIKGRRLRREIRTEKYTMTGPKKVVFTSLQQCDLGRQVDFTSDKKKYQVTYLNNAGGAPDARRERGGGAVEMSVTYTDTGERQEMFGLTARRVKSLTTITPGPTACQKTSMKIESDAWYVDLQGQTCPGLAAEQTFTGESGGCSDRIHYRIEGQPEYGFAVKETRVMTAVGQPPMTLKSEAVELSQTELDPVLFDVPEGYEEDKSSASARTAVGRDDDSRGLGLPAPGNVTGAAQSPPPTPETAPSTTAEAAQMPSTSQLSPKRPGVIRIGVARPKVQTPDSDDDASAPLEVGTVTRDSFVAALKGEAVEAVALTSPQPEQEAKQKECDYTLYSNVVQKRGGGGFFGKMAAMSALSMAGALVPGVGGIVSSVATSVLMQQTMGKSARPKDEFSLEFYAIASADHSLLYKSQSKQKVSKQGEDVLTPQIQKAAAAVMTEVMKKHPSGVKD